MIFVSVGTHTEQFNRLLKEIDSLISSGKIHEKVIAQTGNSTYKPKNFEHFSFSSWKRILKLNRDASLVISHGGAGNLLVASHYSKSIVAVPRLKKFNEHVNDHQVQLVKELEKERRVIGVYDIKTLGKSIRKAKLLRSKNTEMRKEKKIVSIVRDYINEMANEG